jgi:hypothetical protein
MGINKEENRFKNIALIDYKNPKYSKLETLDEKTAQGNELVLQKI